MEVVKYRFSHTDPLTFKYDFCGCFPGDFEGIVNCMTHRQLVAFYTEPA